MTCRTSNQVRQILLEPTAGLEPGDLLITSELLYQLSYVGAARLHQQLGPLFRGAQPNRDHLAWGLSLG